MSNHTPKPWEAQSPIDMEGMRHIFIKDSKGHCLARVDGHKGGDCCGKKGYADFDETTANAQLISASPDLLEACEAWMLVESESMSNNPCPDYALRGRYRDKANELTRAAIEKARKENHCESTKN